nr:nucleotide exchange factor GrpE [Phytohabitans suffuscus]
MRDKRKIDPSGGPAKEAEPAAADKTDEAPAEATKDSPATEGAAKKERKPSHAAPESNEEEASTAEKPAAEKAEPAGPLGAELESLRSDLEERTRDLQRVTAEYANYRKRVDRDRGVQADQATGLVITALLPVLDDLDRAREHGDLVGPFAAVSEQLVAALGKFGLTAFGEKGDPFDPTRHEAVAHRTSSEVTEPTCVEVMRRGYLLGDRLLRAALVAVADPE